MPSTFFSFLDWKGPMSRSYMALQAALSSCRACSSARRISSALITLPYSCLPAASAAISASSTLSELLRFSTTPCRPDVVIFILWKVLALSWHSSPAGGGMAPPRGRRLGAGPGC